MKTIRFIINPASGSGKKQHSGMTKAIEKFLDKNIYCGKIKFTQMPGHATKLGNAFRKKEFDVVVAVGGDGSVNEVGQSLINSNTALGIIPTGSGNGLARFLKIPINIKKAIQILNQGKIQCIDTMSINGKSFVNCAGIGFDAHISYLFATHGKRGFKAYLRIAATEFSNYRTEKYKLKIDDIEIERQAFLICFANSSQFGNNVHIAPKAKVNDGLADVVIVKPHPYLSTFVIALQLLTKTAAKSKYVEMYQGKHIIVYNKSTIKVHLDGEPAEFDGNLEINVSPLSLKVVVP